MQLMKVPPENIMALGDGENDLEMMQVRTSCISSTEDKVKTLP